MKEILEALRKIKDRLPNAENVNCVSVFLFGDQLRLRIDWHGEPPAFYTHIIPLIWLDAALSAEDAENAIIQEIERQWKIFEVGEE